jgi:RNA polymerase sigma-70 factor (ECF subfamily)
MSVARSKPRRRASCKRIPATLDDNLAEHIRALRRYAMTLAGNPHDADDLVQETLRRAIDYGGNRQQVRDWPAYLFRILHNVRNDQLAQQARRPDTVPLEENGMRSMACAPAQDAVIECRSLEAALQELPVSQLRIVLLTGLLGYTYREASAMLGIPLGTVMSRLFRGRAQLRARMRR